MQHAAVPAPLAIAATQVKATGALQKLISPHEGMVPAAVGAAAVQQAQLQVHDYAAGPVAARAVAEPRPAATAAASGATIAGADAPSKRGAGPARRRGGGGRAASAPQVAGSAPQVAGGLQGAVGSQAAGAAGGGDVAGLQAKLLELMGRE